MNSSNLHQTSHAAPDAAYDKLERELVALTSAELDEADAVPAEAVDEFATEFLLLWGLPPK